MKDKKSFKPAFKPHIPNVDVPKKERGQKIEDIQERLDNLHKEVEELSSSDADSGFFETAASNVDSDVASASSMKSKIVRYGDWSEKGKGPAGLQYNDRDGRDDGQFHVRHERDGGHGDYSGSHYHPVESSSKPYKCKDKGNFEGLDPEPDERGYPENHKHSSKNVRSSRNSLK